LGRLNEAFPMAHCHFRVLLLPIFISSETDERQRASNPPMLQAAGLPAISVLLGILLPQRSTDRPEKRTDGFERRTETRSGCLESRLDRIEAGLRAFTAQLANTNPAGCFRKERRLAPIPFEFHLPL